MNQEINNTSMLPIGTMLRGIYRVDSYLSSGGFGNTYVATNTEFEERVAIKEFFMKGVSQRDGDQTTVSISNSDNRDSFLEQKEKFKKEARRLRRLRNEYIVAVHDLFEENGTSYYVMDYVDGENLSERMKRTGKALSEQEVRRLLPQLLQALKTVHEAGLWHLDLKPANIMVNRSGDVRLIDFGASKQLNAQKGGATTGTAISYTNGFAPREQMEQNYDKFGPWTDIYALGATVYNLLTNRRPPLPTDIDDDESSDKHVALPFPDGISADMQALVIRMMKTNRMRRPQSVDEVMEELQRQPEPEHRPEPEPEHAPEPEPEPEPAPSMEEDEEDEETLLAGAEAPQPTVPSADEDDDDEEEKVGTEEGVDTEEAADSDDDSYEYADEGTDKRKYWIGAAIVAVVLLIGGFWYLKFYVDPTYTDPETGMVGKYEGERDNQGRPNGNGLAVFDDYYYEGSFIEGKYSGQGVMVYKNGDKYEGEFVGGMKSGGTMTYANGEQYVGKYTIDMPDGKGIYTWPSSSSNTKSRYEGDFVYGEMTGQGTLDYANGDQYEGTLKNGEPDGDGIMYYANHVCKEGNWSQGTIVKVKKTGTWK